MHVVFISNCDHKALPRTRTLLDRYATRVGDRAWLTLMTQEALEEIQIALRKSATRQTSVACYRNDAVFGLRLLWIVGNGTHYDTEGRFAVATKIRTKEFPMYFRHAALVARFAGYCHDFGKASELFQKKLKDSTGGEINKTADPVRHEWLSAWLVGHLVANDCPLNLERFRESWKKMGNKPTDEHDLPVPDRITGGLDAALWAIGTHHGAIGGGIEDDGITNDRHVRKSTVANNGTWKNFAFTDPCKPSDADSWESLFGDINKTLDRLAKIERPNHYWEGVMVTARAALILADHKISSEKYLGTVSDISKTLFANTKKNENQEQFKRNVRKPSKSANQKRFLDQPLVWHLRTVGEQAADNLRVLSGEGLPTVDNRLVRELLGDRPDNGKFIWQNAAVDAVSRSVLPGGGLVFNVASTGAGKTLANLKMAAAMRPDDLRLAVAFNLRSLTTQTHVAFGNHIKRINEEVFKQFFRRDFACLIGESEIDIPEFAQEDNDRSDDDNIEWLDEDEIKGAEELEIPSWLNTHIANDVSRAKLAKLIASPVLASTMDWIAASGEPGEQARHVKALIRVINSDLILDEVDSYDVKATVAVMRVVQTAASFGRNVIVSSATLNPELAEGLTMAYAFGRRVFEAMTSKNEWHLVMVSDLFEPVKLFAPSPEDADKTYRKTMLDMTEELRRRPPTKRFRIANVNSPENFNEVIASQSARLHEDTASKPDGLNCRLSIGLVRVANVTPCMDVADWLASDADGRFMVTAYHARETDYRRGWKESWLDRVLNRTDGSGWVDALKEICPGIENRTDDVRLIVVATPVEEVGRDHDFDWAVIEPSSIHSIIQTAGRVNRHRMTWLEENQLNVAILSKNLRELNNEDKCFVYPGLEREKEAGKNETTHKSHDMNELLKGVPGQDADEPVNTLDASLIFGSRQTVFAQCDEMSVALTIKAAKKVIDRSEGHQTGFMKLNYQQEFPLRDRDRRLYYRREDDKIHLKTEQNNKKNSGCFLDKYNEVNNKLTWLNPPNQPKDSFTITIGSNLPTKVEGLWNGLIFE